MKNQIFLLLFLVTYYYCKGESDDSISTTDFDSTTNNESYPTTNDQNITEISLIETTLTIKSTTTVKTPVTENPILANISAEVLRLVSDLLPGFLTKLDKVHSMDINRTVIKFIKKIFSINFNFIGVI